MVRAGGSRPGQTSTGCKRRDAGDGGQNGIPSARTVLLKGLDERGFIFFTNYDSRKGRELAQNPNAALVFYWQELERQVCIAGSVTKTSREESENYFKSRPHGSRLAAWASNQSEMVSYCGFRKPDGRNWKRNLPRTFRYRRTGVDSF